MKLTLAQPNHAAALARFLQTVHGAGFPHAELLDPAVLQQRLRERELTMVVAINDDGVLGCGLAFPQEHNQTIELGTLSVGAVPQRTQVGKAIFEALRRYGLKEYGVAYFRARTEAAFRRGRDIGATCWGFWPQPQAQSLEDSELIMGFFNTDHQVRRVEPPTNALVSADFARRIVESLHGAEDGVLYPKTFPVGRPRGTGTPVISGNIWPTFHSRENYLTIESSAGPYPMEILREFIGKVRTKGVRDIRLVLSVNHDQAFVDLLEFGFVATAYLPGWFLRGNNRFDCVQLVSGLPRRRGDGFMGRVVERVLRQLEVK